MDNVMIWNSNRFDLKRMDSSMKAHAFFTFAMLAALPAAAFDYPVSFATVDCNGGAGMVSVDVAKIYKLQSVTCENGTVLRQVMMRNDAGSYDIATVSAEEAEALQQEIQAYTRARREALKKGGTVIIGN